MADETSFLKLGLSSQRTVVTPTCALTVLLHGWNIVIAFPLRPDQINLLLLGFFKPENKLNWSGLT